MLNGTEDISVSKKFLITGGAGFIGSAVCRTILNNSGHSIVNIDKLTYAGNLESLVSLEKNEKWLVNEPKDVHNLNSSWLVNPK